MKQSIYFFLLTTALFACQSKTETKTTASEAYPANAFGYNIDSTRNIEIVLKTVAAMEALDTAAYRSYYAPDVVFHDNLDSMNIDQNIKLISSFKENGVTVKITKTEPIWEAVNKKPSPKGVTNYVMSYQYADFTKGDKTVKVVMNTVDAFKDGKIVEEWITYDTRKIFELLQ